MTSGAVRSSIVALLMTALPYPAQSADVLHDQTRSSVKAGSVPALSAVTRISGRTSVIDGRTLWFPIGQHKVRLAWIDACELPQWSYDPRRHGEDAIPKPVPCGPLAKAWLKRMVGNAQVSCLVQAYDGDGGLLGRCTVRGRDLALEMLRVGWARVTSPAPAEYLTWQNYAMSARHGMWATYVLDMPEWRRKAVDRTLARPPIADFNLLAERESEISPPFEDVRKRPRRTDR
ncbi:thermonuclease family protein [Mesorhizobium australicum]|uniref:Endonuclease YncB, thermonuclease family n=1 Tax=Mesorhizobium australicum TaxID=536018 RepID=A0A1X7MP01_9HYPH|nr:thermonuclease family protein [Mesorhizobium australicum]SMH26579.1 Endonuclease YncB, thermonuclease family [Mesorhizobium australicum]